MMTKIQINRNLEKEQFVIQKEKFINLCEQNGKVFTFSQSEFPEEEKIALCFDETDFWVGCFKTVKEAKMKAKELGLKFI